MTSKEDQTFIHHLDRVIEKHSLLNHPFYVAWSNGELPLAALRDYAGEYGAFIATISDGWRAVGNGAVAAVEEHHTQVWEASFAASLGTSVSQPVVPQVGDLVALSREMFADNVTALGALYAFESQQPLTAQTKLTGINEHYSQLPEASGDYFRLHEMDYDEPAMLAHQIECLAQPDRERALDACMRMSQALYDALTGIYASHSQ